MAGIFHCFVVGDPKPQPRPRAFVMGTSARVYNPATAEGWKSQIAESIRAARAPRFESFVMLRLVFNFRRPKSHYSKKGLRAGIQPYPKKDTDNHAKAVMDALTHLRVWPDDSYVVHLEVQNQWAIGDSVGCAIFITDL